MDQNNDKIPVMLKNQIWSCLRHHSHNYLHNSIGSAYISLDHAMQDSKEKMLMKSIKMVSKVSNFKTWTSNYQNRSKYELVLHTHTYIYITNLVCYTYFHWFFSPECQHIFGKQTGYIFQSPKMIKTWTTKHHASLNQWYNTE